MHCPHCHEKLWSRETLCPFCHREIAPETLLEDPSTAPPPEATAWATLKECEHLVAADALRSRLEAAGFTVLIPDESLMQAVAWNVNTYGFVRVQVPATDLEAARQILASWQTEIAPPPEAPETPRGQLPLPMGMRLIAFFLPLFCCPALFVFAAARNGYARQGCERKSEDFGAWFLAGTIVWFLLGAATYFAKFS